jgi:radical SAM superfamily enzyme YgiQ (UPF0313 family)
MQTTRVLLINIPRLEPHRPPIGTAIIGNVLKIKGYRVTALDLNIKFFHRNNDLFHEMDAVFDKIRPITYTEYKKIILLFREFYKPLFGNFDVVALSIFGDNATIFAKMLLQYTRKYAPTKRIVIGGAGVMDVSVYNTKTFGQAMLDWNLCDTYVVGDGEETIINAIEGVPGPGINNENFKQIDNVNEAPFPNYEFFDLDEYDYLENKKEVYVVGSRGCVRHCTYCDVQRYWPKFKFRSGNNIADELITHYENHGISNFYFADSLINGSRKAFIEMCSILAKYNTDHDANFSWKGQFIFKRKHQVSNEYFDIISEAGGNEFYVGVETGSDKIRWEMDKKFTNEDIDYHLEQFNRTGLSVFFLMLTGYVTETKQDHLDTLEMFKRWQYYVATGTISGIDFGKTLLILYGTPLYDMIKDEDISFLPNINNSGEISKLNSFWTSGKNPSLTVPERIRRRLEIQEVAIEYNWPVWRGAQRLQSIEQLVIEYNRRKHTNTSTIPLIQH